MRGKIQKRILQVCDVLELASAVLVGIAIIAALIALVPEFFHFWDNRLETSAFLLFLEEVLNVVIGIEFMKMLCKPNPEYIIEGLIFLVARHMIVGTTTSAEDLLSILGIAILFVLSHFLKQAKQSEKTL